jgi:hypothetical protein
MSWFLCYVMVLLLTFYPGDDTDTSVSDIFDIRRRYHTTQPGPKGIALPGLAALPLAGI